MNDAHRFFITLPTTAGYFARRYRSVRPWIAKQCHGHIRPGPGPRVVMNRRYMVKLGWRFFNGQP